MDLIKESFQKIKQEIECIHEELSLLKKNIRENDRRLLDFAVILENLLENRKIEFQPKDPNRSTNNTIFTTNQRVNPTNNLVFRPLKDKNLTISIGNEGVPTDRQTDRQTDKKTQKEVNSIEKITDILNSLDSLKKEVRLKFKRLTEQEMLIFSKIYQLEESYGYTDYKTLSSEFNLTESSIRDYIGRLIKKGIPIEKLKLNNKKIQLKISSNLKKIASLNTILKLREI
jgi:hypothetical protein